MSDYLCHPALSRLLSDNIFIDLYESSERGLVSYIISKSQMEIKQEALIKRGIRKL